MGSLINGDETEQGSTNLKLEFLPCLPDRKTNTCTNKTYNDTIKWLNGAENQTALYQIYNREDFV